MRVADAKRGIDLTASDLWYDRDTKIARIRGNAEMADLENEIVVKGGFLEDRDEEGLTIIQIGVRIFRKDSSAGPSSRSTGGTRRSSS